MANKAGMIHPQRVQPYRQYTPNEFSNQDGMPHIMSVNKQFGGNKWATCLSLSYFSKVEYTSLKQDRRFINEDGSSNFLSRGFS